MQDLGSAAQMAFILDPTAVPFNRVLARLQVAGQLSVDNGQGFAPATQSRCRSQSLVSLGRATRTLKSEAVAKTDKPAPLCGTELAVEKGIIAGYGPCVGGLPGAGCSAPLVDGPCPAGG